MIRFIFNYEFVYVFIGIVIYVIGIDMLVVERFIFVEGFDIVIDFNGLFVYVFNFGLV